jgi:anti-anti-sigma factor
VNQQLRAPSPLGEVSASHYGGDVWIVSLTGEHDLSNVGELDERLREVHTHGTRVVLDLSEASFIDSSVIARVVGEASHAARKPGDDLAVVAPAGSQARRVLGIIQVERVRIVDSRDDALAAMGADTVPRDPTSEMAGGGFDD